MGLLIIGFIVGAVVGVTFYQIFGQPVYPTPDTDVRNCEQECIYTDDGPIRVTYD